MVYGRASEVESNTIAVFTRLLRHKLGEEVIRTVHGQGYRADAAAASTCR